MARQSRKAIVRPMFPVRFARLHGRLLISLAIGVAVSLGLLIWSGWRVPTKLLTGWDVFALLYVGLIHQVMAQCGVAQIRARAAEEDEGAVVLLILTCIAAIAALVALVAELGDKSARDGWHVGLAIATILLSWCFVHTIFALHYSHEFYGEGRDRQKGGLAFPGTREPDYWDFVYFSLVIAMTSQVSDVQITSRSIRRIATMHGVLSFFFNLGILALTINMVSNLI